MKNVTVCDRDSAIIRPEDKAFKVNITIGGGTEEWNKEFDLCEKCMGIVARGIANRVFLVHELENEILSKVGCAMVENKTDTESVEKKKKKQLLTKDK